ncbi:MAG TPA: oligopeptide transporter, OPT family [Steroidobacteraceae bacterium]|jgi:putative OPT family oligopeptide transporter|nr:oligopeptide transporter, OPT family [Steroidobacteraceae bacterium]
MNAIEQTGRELTVRAIILSVILAVLMGAANTYLGLFAGLTIASAIPSAVVSMAVLKLLGHGGILENNIVQTGGSAGSSTATGMLFTTPALVMLGAWHEYRYPWVFGFAAMGGLLGVLFTVPLRRALIVEQKLPFPEGTAAAEVLRAGADPAHGAKLLAGAAALGAIVKVMAENGLKLIPDTAQIGARFGRAIGFVSNDLSPALLGVGYICGRNVGIVMLVGAFLSFNIAIPIYSTWFLDPASPLGQQVAAATATAAATAIWKQQIRFIGVGGMLIGGLWTLVSLRGSLLSGISSGVEAMRRSASAARLGGPAVPATEQDVPMKWVLIGTLAASLPLMFMYHAVVGSFLISIPMTLAMIILSFIFCSVSGYMAGLVGSTNDPVSGMIISTMLASSAMLLVITHGNSVVGPVAAVMIGAAVCSALSIAGDNTQDLKCGQLVGATPWKQQIIMAVGAATSALVLAPVLNLLNNAYGIGVADATHPHPLAAPQATMIMAVSRGMFGGQLPWDMILVGAGVGVVVILIDEALRKRGSSFRTPVLGVAVGMYLPYGISLPIFIGGMLSHFAHRARDRHAGQSDGSVAEEGLASRGMLYAAGMIAGESLTGVLLAIPIVATNNPDAAALPPAWRLFDSTPGMLLGVASYCLLGFLLYRIASKPAR